MLLPNRPTKLTHLRNRTIPLKRSGGAVDAVDVDGGARVQELRLVSRRKPLRKQARLHLFRLRANRLPEPRRLAPPFKNERP